MQLVSDPSFDERQQQLVAALLEAIARQLVRVDAPREMVEELTGSIGFAVASLIDDTGGIEFGEGELSPMLTFEIEDGKLAYADGNSWMHEYVFDLLPQVLEKIRGESNGGDET